jgi:hypothetical protein
VKVSRRLVANLYVLFSTRPWTFVQVRLNPDDRTLGA